MVTPDLRVLTPGLCSVLCIKTAAMFYAINSTVGLEDEVCFTSNRCVKPFEFCTSTRRLYMQHDQDKASTYSTVKEMQRGMYYCLHTVGACARGPGCTTCLHAPTRAVVQGKTAILRPMRLMYCDHNTMILILLICLQKRRRAGHVDVVSASKRTNSSNQQSVRYPAWHVQAALHSVVRVI